MREKGFTLVELLAVIIILSIVSVVAIPRLIKSVKSNTVDTYNGIIENIILAANSYANNQGGILVQIPVSYLQQEGYLPRNLSNPIDNTLLNGCVYVVDGTPIYKEETCSTYLKGIEPSRIVSTNQSQYVLNYTYTGDYQEFVAPRDGTYKIELWGAQGKGTYGGLGGYTSGNISLHMNDKLYIYVGQRNTNITATFNASGAVGNSNYNSGGGATDVRYFSSTPASEDLVWTSTLGLNSRIMVAAGGGGYGAGRTSDVYLGGAGGGLIGGDASVNDETAAISKGSTQTASGAVGTWTGGLSGNAGSFGVGASGSFNNSSSNRVGGGGGGGYYGGASGPTCSGDCSFSGSGGSSFISGHPGCLAIASSSSRSLKSGCTSSSTSVECSTHYSGLYFTDTVMIDGAGYAWTTTKGSATGMPRYDSTTGTMTGNAGAGHARITLLNQ